MNDGLTGEELDAREAYVRPLLDWACNGAAGVSESHPHYAAVTEHRDEGSARAGYSSCADLAHWLLFRLGCRQPWINRAEHYVGDLGKPGWDTSVNVSRLAWNVATTCARTPLPGVRFSPGDILIVWNHPRGKDAHVMVVYEHNSAELVVGEYGQPGGHVKAHELHAKGHALYIGQRRVQRWLVLDLVLENAAERGELEDVTLPDHFTDTEPAPPPSEGT